MQFKQFRHRLHLISITKTNSLTLENSLYSENRKQHLNDCVQRREFCNVKSDRIYCVLATLLYRRCTVLCAEQSHPSGPPNDFRQRKNLQIYIYIYIYIYKPPYAKNVGARFMVHFFHYLFRPLLVAISRWFM
jgi:hypothetical protein